MSVIRFRAWDMTAGKMAYNLSIDYMSGWMGSDSVCCVDCLFKKTRHNLTWMQFTGLTDKAGVDIYEGDIVKHGRNVKKIFWNPNTPSFMMRFTKNQGVAGEDCFLAKSYCSGLVVIGNIYKNPELLNKTSEKGE